MGCGSNKGLQTQLQKEIESKDEEAQRQKKLLLEKDHQLAQLQIQHGQLEKRLEDTEAQVSTKGADDGADSTMNKELLRQIDERKMLHQREMQQQQELLDLQHREELRRQLDEKDRVHRKSLEEREDRHKEALRLEGERSEAMHRDALRSAENCAEDDVRQQKRRADKAQQDLEDMRAHLSRLKAEKEDSADALRDVQEQLSIERAQRRKVEQQLAPLEARLAEFRGEESSVRARTDALERQTHALRTDLALRSEELQQKDSLLCAREVELGEVQQSLSGLQSLFDEVSEQLQSECGRVERLQSTVALCAKQGQELQALQAMLEESHSMLGQVREALERERRQRRGTQQLLEQERMRTHLLLDVLKHFKEKLQCLTPQMLLGRLNEANISGRALNGPSFASKAAPLFFDIGSPKAPGDIGISPGPPQSLWGCDTPSLTKPFYAPAASVPTSAAAFGSPKKPCSASDELLKSLHALEAAGELKLPADIHDIHDTSRSSGGRDGGEVQTIMLDHNFSRSPSDSPPSALGVSHLSAVSVRSTESPAQFPSAPKTANGLGTSLSDGIHVPAAWGCPEEKSIVPGDEDQDQE